MIDLPISNQAKPLNITLAQLNPMLGDIKGNGQVILDIWQNASADNSDLVIFPELFLCGYPPEDLMLNRAFIKQIEEEIFFICKESLDFKAAAIVPVPWLINKDLYNAALLIENGKINHIFTKHKLPNYSVFDELRTFTSAKLPEPVNFRGINLGVMICEDAWFEHVPKYLKEKGAQLLISINASPYSTKQMQIRHKLISDHVKETKLPFIYLNMIGGQDELVFDGRSFIVNENNNIIYQAPAFKEEIIELKIENSTIEVSNLENTKNKDESEISVTYEALKIGLRDYVHKNGFKDVIIGLSGGIDSALSTAIAVDALGKDHVHCVMLPSEFTSQESLNDAKECAEMLGVKYDILPITEALKTFEKIIPDLSGIAHENTQSRIRGVILMALSNANGSMLVSTGNKSEMAVGYCTLYGDMNGGFNALKDVYKTMVYKLSKWRGLPENIITKEPSAELRDNQKDQDSLPPYDLLDDILELLLEENNIDLKNSSPDLLKKHDNCLKYPEIIEKIAKLLKNTEYKRYQAPPGTRITPYAFGRDRRYPMTNNFVNKIEKN